MRCAWDKKKVNLSWVARLPWQGVWVFVIALCFVFGCGKRKEETPAKPESVYVNRANDKTYISLLMTNRQQQVKDAHAQRAISLKMTQCVSRVRATLPAEVTDEALRKALASDPEWVALDEQAKKADASAKQTLKKAQEMVRLRLLEEKRANEAVAEGKAKAKDALKPAATVEKK